MTKESILDQVVKYAWECDQASPVIPYSEAENAMDEWAGHLISGSQSVTTTYQVPKHILDEYAKQRAIAYDEWKWANRWFSLENGFWYQTLEHPTAMPDKTYNKYHRKTPDELYSQFIEQQTKDK